MPNLLLYLEPDEEHSDAMTLWAADLLEALNVSGDGASSKHLRATVVASEIDCMDLALSYLGRTDAMTVEGGERHPSGLNMYLVRMHQSNKEIGLPEQIEHCIADLQHLGLVDRIDRFASFADAMKSASSEGDWTGMILVASQRRIHELQKMVSKPFIHPEMSGSFAKNAGKYLTPQGDSESGAYRNWEIEAVLQALQFADLLRRAESAM